MYDQANDLRQLVRTTALRFHQRPEHPSTLVTFVGGKGGVGTTTLATNFAVACALAGHRTVLVDAALGRADCAALCRIEPAYDVGDVLAGKRSVHEVLVRGPGGIQMVPGRWAASHLDDSPPAQDRLLDQLRNLGAHADLVILDVGASLHGVTRRYWRASDGIVAVTIPEHSAVMETYAAMKIMHAKGANVPTSILVNRATREVADDVFDRLGRAAKRFLAVDLTLLGAVPDDPAVGDATASRRPFVTQSDTPVANVVTAFVEKFESWIGENASSAVPQVA